MTHQLCQHCLKVPAPNGRYNTLQKYRGKWYHPQCLEQIREKKAVVLKKRRKKKK